MIRKTIYTLVILLIISLLGFFFVAGRIVDQQMNVLIQHEFEALPQTSKDFHQTLQVADWHADNLLWDRNPLVRIDHGHIDIPRLIDGNFTLQVFDAVIKTPKGMNYQSNTGDTDNITMLAMVNRWPIKTWSSLCARAIYQSEKLHNCAANSDDRLVIIKSSTDLKKLIHDRKTDTNKVGGLLSIEGLHALEGKIENLDRLYEAGYRMMGLTHFFDNEVGGSSAGVDQGGLTPFGREVIQKMIQKGIIIDLAHASSALIDDVLTQTSRPIVVSHTGVKGTYDSPRNLSDEQLKKIAENGGMIGIGFWAEAVGSTSLVAIARAMRHVINTIGVEHVCLGSDWDGGTTILFGADHISQLTHTLLKEGFTEAEVRLIMGENQINFLLNNL